MFIFNINDLEEARKQNSAEICFVLADGVDLFGFVDAVKSLYHNQTSETGLCAVVFSGEENHINTDRAWNIPALKELMNAISKIPKVNYLGFQWIHSQNKLPVELLSNLFQKMKHQINTLEINSVALVGEQQQVQEFEQALQSMPGLRNYLSNDMSIFASNNIHQRNAAPLNLDSIFTTISGLPMITYVEIEDSSAPLPGSNDIWRKGVASTKTLQCLLSSTQISFLRLSIGELDLDPEGLESLVQAIGMNSNIVELQLNFICPERNKDTAMSKTPAFFLARALQINTTLREVSVSLHEDTPSAEYEAFLVEMAKAIGKNPDSAVRKLSIDSPGTLFPPVAKDAFINLLKTNYNIEDWQYKVERTAPADGCTWLAGEKEASIDFYLRLNAKGRKRLMSKAIEKVTRAQLVSTLATVSNDFDALYYYLRLNPCLFLKEANHSYRGRGKTRSRPSSPENTSKDDEIERLKRELGATQKELGKAQEELGVAHGEIKRLKKLLENKDTDDA